MSMKPLEDWQPDHPLVRWVLRAPRDFDLFQLLQIVERTNPGAAPIGDVGPARNEPVRLRPWMSLSFPPGDIDSATWREDATSPHGRLLITTTFLGLYGCDSPLPPHYTESLISDTDDDRRVRDFLDLFHHRLQSLLFRVWMKYRYHVVFHPQGRDPVSLIVRGLLGIGTPHLDEQIRGNPVQLFRYTGLMVQRPRSAGGLAGILRDHFGGLPVSVEQCVGKWIAIDRSQQNRLGMANCALGESLLLGERIYDVTGKFRVKIGPVDRETFFRFLPGEPATAALAEIARFYCTDPLDFDTEVTLRGEEVPELPLGEHGKLGRLGWTSWAKSKPCGDKAVVIG